LENFDLRAMGYNSSGYIHTVYQAMNLTFADRYFYYGDPYFPPGEPISGLLNKEYAKKRASLIKFDKNDENAGPGDPYPYEGKSNPYTNLLKERESITDTAKSGSGKPIPAQDRNQSAINKNNIAFTDPVYMDRLWRGTTSVEAADKAGWVVSITPSGGWLPACIAGHTGVGMSQRMQSFVLDSSINPFNVLAPGKHPRVTLTPTLALKDSKPFLCFGVQGGDTQDQNLLQFFLNMVEFGMTVQQATEAANFNSSQLWLSLGGSKIEDRKPRPGEILLANSTPDSVRNDLRKMGYKMSFGNRTSGPINAIYLDSKHGSLWGGSSNNGEDYGIGW
jgi:gamma-glutamyltranspeptidase / glutathione hydrolase